MKLVILQENLKKYLNLTERIIGRNLTLPILNNILLTIEKNSLKLSVTDLEITLEIWLPVKIEENGSLTIPNKLLNNFINQLSNIKDQKLILESKDDNLNITLENYSITINGMNAKDFPIIPKIKTNSALELDNSMFKLSLSQILNSAAFSEIRPEISGVFFNFTNSNEKIKNFKLVTTDTFRLAEKKIECSFKEKPASFIIPIKTITELVRLFDLTEKQTTKIYLDNNQVLFDLGNIHLSSRLIEGEYPNYEPIIPKKNQTKIIIDKNNLINSVKIASVFSSKINDIKFKINPNKEKMEIFTKSEYGENKSEINIKGQGEEVEISFNHKYILDGLSNILGNEAVMEFQGSQNPALLKSNSDDDYIYIAMPLRLN